MRQMPTVQRVIDMPMFRIAVASLMLASVGACVPQPETSTTGQVNVRQAVTEEAHVRAIARGFVFRCAGRRIVERETDRKKAFETRMARFEAQGFAREDVIAEMKRLGDPVVDRQFQRNVGAYLSARGVPLGGPSAKACAAGIAEIDAATRVGRLLRRA